MPKYYKDKAFHPETFQKKKVFKQLNDFLGVNTVVEKFQSGFRSQYSTETALVKVVNDLRMNTNEKKPSVFVLLDLSAACHTVDHNILLDRFENWIGLSGTVLKCFSSYLSYLLKILCGHG